ncbi:MAG: ABC transporter permease, partial [Cytophagales bacterium]|nr:ABC transporter permease [Cytophagales bacterium]
ESNHSIPERARRVGSVLDKTISGGQRKRLNIALELIREPAVLFVDEPTSGLSSRDSENVIDLLKELSLKGKLIFVVIHQPSSDIYKMFDKMVIMDTGGYQIYYGHPVEAVTYFKRVSKQVDSERGQCPTCGNVNPEQIFNIIEAQVVDEYGQLTNKRKVSPSQWEAQYREGFRVEALPDVLEEPEHTLNIPSKVKQSIIFTTRDFLSKISNTQYLAINLLEAPLLAAILAFIIKYNSSPDHQSYIFRFNENFPAFMLMSIIVALFMGLSVSAEEIIRDRKILKREQFLNLSWNSYLSSKIVILFFLSAIQTFSFVLIGSVILGISEWHIFLSFWLVLFSTSCFANVLGLNISSAFKSAITVYILIPLLLIPQMILSGLLFSFDKLHPWITTKGKVPLVADVMASRWAYEALAVYQFKNNTYQAPYYDMEKIERQADFRSAYLLKKLEDKVNFIHDHFPTDDDSVRSLIQKDLRIIREELLKEPFKKPLAGLDFEKDFELDQLNPQTLALLQQALPVLGQTYLDIYNTYVQKRDKLVHAFENYPGYDYNLNEYKNRYFNESLSDLVRNISVKDRILEYEGKLIQQIDPIFNDHEPRHALDYRTHFFAPEKIFLGLRFDTFVFDLLVIWVMTILLYVALYFEGLKKMLSAFSKIRLPGLKK